MLKLQEISEPDLTIIPVERTLEDWCDAMALTDATKALVLGADIALVPTTMRENEAGLLFPENTYQLFQYLQSNAAGNRIEICAEDEQYRELELHFNEIHLVEIICTLFAAPLVINLLSSYLYDRIKQSDKTGLKVKAKLTVRTPEKALTFKYDGPAQTFQEVMGNALSQGGNQNAND